MWIEQAEQGECIHACGSNKPSGRTSLTNSATFEAQHTAADLCIHDPAIVVDTGDHRGTSMKEKTPMHELLRGTVKYYSPQHAQIGQFSMILSAPGRFLFQ